jgi:acetyltransferase-like isoleucine patch superfamily enzyme
MINRKYLSASNYIDFLRRKISLSIRRLALIFSNVEVSSSADISLFASISARSGKIKIGERVLIERGSIIRSYGGMISIGDDCTVGPNTAIYGGGTLKIGKGVRIGPLCAIVAANHNYDLRDELIFRQGMTTKGIEISDDVWIGAGAKVLDGVQIGQGVVIAAGAIVTKSVPDWEVAAGIPAKKIGVRGSIEN